MTDKGYNLQLKRVRALKKKWFSKLGMGWWKIDINYYDIPRKADLKTAYSPKIMNGYWESAMVTCCDPFYLTASIEVYTPIIKNMSDEELEETFLHECMHIFLSPMHAQKTADQEEQVATRLARAFIWSTKNE